MFRTLGRFVPICINKEYYKDSFNATTFNIAEKKPKQFINHKSCEYQRHYGYDKQHKEAMEFARKVNATKELKKFTRAYIVKAAKTLNKSENLTLRMMLAYEGTNEKKQLPFMMKLDTMAVEIGYEKRTIQRALNIIEKLGFFTRKQYNKYSVNVFVCHLDKTRRGILFNALAEIESHVMRETKKPVKRSEYALYREKVAAEFFSKKVIHSIHNKCHTVIRESYIYKKNLLNFKNIPLSSSVNMAKKTLSTPISTSNNQTFLKKDGERETKLTITRVVEELAGCLGYDASMEQLRRQARELLYRDLQNVAVTEVMVEDVVKKTCALVSKKRGKTNLDKSRLYMQSKPTSYIPNTPKTNKIEPQVNRAPFELVLFCLDNKIDLTPKIIDRYVQISDDAERKGFKDHIKFLAMIDRDIAEAKQKGLCNEDI